MSTAAMPSYNVCPQLYLCLYTIDFNATTSTDRVGYEYVLVPMVFITMNTNSFLFLNFVRSRRLKTVGFWYKRPELHCTAL